MLTKKTTMTAGKALVECIWREGVRHVFNVPGESYLAALDAFYDYPDIQLITNRQEGGACYMAEAYAKATCSVGVCFVTRGPGATNASIAVHCATQDSTPLVLFVGQVPRDNRDREAFQEMDYRRFFGSIAKWVVEIDRPARLPQLVTRAFHIARSGRPGPVVVALPEDMLTESTEMHLPSPFTYAPPQPDLQALSMLLNRLDQATKPVVIAGGGVRYAKATALLERFAERFQLPVVTSWRRLDSFPNHHPHYAGNLTPPLNAVREYVNSADVVLVIGDRLSEMTSGDYKTPTAEQVLLQIDVDSSVFGQNFPAEMAIVSDAAAALTAALEFPCEKAETRKAWVAEGRAMYEQFSTPPQITSMLVSMEHVVKVMNDLLPEDAIITTDAGNSTGWVQRYYRFRAPHSFLGPTVGSMGYGMPAAVAAGLAFPNRVVVGTSGDGGYMMNGQELATAVQYGVKIIFLVFNNQSLGTIRMHQEREYPERLVGTNLQNPDFAALARAYGALGFTVKTNAEFAPALKEALQSEKSSVIEVQTDIEQLAVGGMTLTQMRAKHQ